VTGAKLQIVALFAAPTVTELSRLIESSQTHPPFVAGRADPRARLASAVLLRRRWSAILGSRSASLSLVLQNAELGSSPHTEEIAAFHVRSIRAIQPEGPYFVGGWCREGIVAYEIPQQLCAQGQEGRLASAVRQVNPRPWAKFPASLKPAVARRRAAAEGSVLSVRVARLAAGRAPGFCARKALRAGGAAEVSGPVTAHLYRLRAAAIGCAGKTSTNSCTSRCSITGRKPMRPGHLVPG
jgi:hypothetical protein